MILTVVLVQHLISPLCLPLQHLAFTGSNVKTVSHLLLGFNEHSVLGLLAEVFLRSQVSELLISPVLPMLHSAIINFNIHLRGKYINRGDKRSRDGN